jgi:hypothetical protein
MSIRSIRLAWLIPLLGFAACGDGTEPIAPESSLRPGEPQPATQLNVPEDHPGNPFYALLFNGLTPDSPHFFFPHANGWGAVAFERELGCVPPDFNLLLEFDFTPAFPGGPPRSMLCTLTVEGVQVWHNPPDPITVDPGPIFIMSRGLGDVPVVFARWDEIEAAMADAVLTLPELLALPSAMVGSADHFVALYVNGPAPDDRLMNRLSASGTLPDGRAFRVLAVERPAGTDYQVEFR